MHKLIHALCALVCVAVIGGMMTHGMSDLRHDVLHAAMEHTDEFGHDHNEAQSDVVEIVSEPGEVDTPFATLPSGHHHHSGGDSHAALFETQSGVFRLPSVRVSLTTLGASQLPEGLIIDGPEHPPKQLRLIA